MAAVRPRVPSESEEQQALFLWATYMSTVMPELDLLYHIPNGGKRSKAEAGRFRAEGVKSGVPDVCLPVARGGFHGLYIELKRTEGGVVSENQKRWMRKLIRQGYLAVVCRGWEEARIEIEAYLQGRIERIGREADDSRLPGV